MPQGRVEGPFLYMLAMLPLMSWIACVSTTGEGTTQVTSTGIFG